ncbi:SMI1/KNR4 family protein [Streptomyces sp. WMMC940]|uniref:SMI1/KNR4 family protein n=1 Tax=Streptomyces sp. WMMC940 TaxID=3015153 RepID=UPI0022B6690E|nr:SMI1/KNR4 family protein [Streptomyces sp. WMMC940]MCZ7458254.1 SMI1/KNR4 family protein [Streptomyces sp. WMMC940]
MTTDLVEGSWDRIDDWLRKHAPRTFASLGPPAADEEIRAAEVELGVAFHPDLVASLRRHNGARGGVEAFQFTTHDRLLGVREIVEATGFMRGIAADLDEEEAEYYWHHGYLKFGTYEVTADGFTIDCRPGRGSYGAIGRFFDETGTDFGRADSLGAYLAELAYRLEGGKGPSAVAFNGRLIWESARAPRPEWGSVDDPLPGPEAQLPPLDLPADPTEPLKVGYLHGLEELGALVATLPRERVAYAAWKQMRRLAVETGLAKYVEVTTALDALERGEAVLPGQVGPLGLRLRKVIVQSDAHRDDLRRWAAQDMVVAAWGSPHQAVCKIATTRSHLSVGWRAELLADLGSPPIPTVPDDCSGRACATPTSIRVGTRLATPRTRADAYTGVGQEARGHVRLRLRWHTLTLWVAQDIDSPTAKAEPGVEEFSCSIRVPEVKASCQVVRGGPVTGHRTGRTIRPRLARHWRAGGPFVARRLGRCGGGSCPHRSWELRHAPPSLRPPPRHPYGEHRPPVSARGA